MARKRAVKSQKNTSKRIRVVRPKIHLIAGVVSVIVCLVLGCGTYSSNKSAAMFFFAMLIPCVGIVALCVLSRWEIRVDGDIMTYINTFGKTVEYTLDDPTKVIFGANKLTIIAEGKKEIEVYSNCVNYEKFKRHVMSTDIRKQWNQSYNVKRR